MVNYSYTPGDKIVGLNEDAVQVETEGMIFEMGLVDLFESWLDYQCLDEDYLEENSTKKKMRRLEGDDSQKAQLKRGSMAMGKMAASEIAQAKKDHAKYDYEGEKMHKDFAKEDIKSGKEIKKCAKNA